MPNQLTNTTEMNNTSRDSVTVNVTEKINKRKKKLPVIYSQIT